MIPNNTGPKKLEKPHVPILHPFITGSQDFYTFFMNQLLIVINGIGNTTPWLNTDKIAAFSCPQTEIGKFFKKEIKAMSIKIGDERNLMGL